MRDTVIDTRTWMVWPWAIVAVLALAACSDKPTPACRIARENAGEAWRIAAAGADECRAELPQQEKGRETLDVQAAAAELQTCTAIARLHATKYAEGLPDQMPDNPCPALVQLRTSVGYRDVCPGLADRAREALTESRSAWKECR